MGLTRLILIGDTIVWFILASNGNVVAFNSTPATRDFENCTDFSNRQMSEPGRSLLLTRRALDKDLYFAEGHF